MSYTLWYWPGIPGRGEFIRLALEASGIAYRDGAAEGGRDAILEALEAAEGPPLAPPFLDTGDSVIAQTAAILDWLARAHDGLAPPGEAGRSRALQHQLTILDALDEVHEVHHPIAGSLYYEDQKDEAARRAHFLRTERLPRFLGHFEAVLARSDGEWLLGDSWCHADLSLFQLVDGLLYAFPLRMTALAVNVPKVMALHGRVRALPALQAYFESGRRQPYGDGIFRHYPELDAV
ncbi:glutathione S-transferase [Parasphingopyxis marina]|uniref:Glutathione S-transferase n=1 Tax=Parasphingopyxis marina TaxID=2761622 RepID=A0A842I1A4_9SPHN|nr:glutathione S-transferase [Parasphingopyxis marina]MBC2779012.1 glutathione S-transferase [Parasphingopyxis marina]